MKLSEYVDKIQNDILKDKSDELKLLKWIITYHYSLETGIIPESNPFFSKHKTAMVKACKSLHITISDSKDDSFPTDCDYIHSILSYARSCAKKSNNEYGSLLFVYSLAVSTNARKKFCLSSNALGRAFSKYARNYSSLHKDLLNQVSFADKAIFALYLWFSDICIISEYNNITDYARDCINDNVPIEIDKTISNIFSNIYQLHSKADYYYLNPYQTDKTRTTITNTKHVFNNFLQNYQDTLMPFAPSAITIVFNSLLPTKMSRIKADYSISNKALLRNVDRNNEYTLDKKRALPAKNDTSFLKMLILPRNDYNLYDKNKSNTIEKQFFKYEFENFCQLFRKLYEEAMSAKNNIKTISFYNGWELKEIDLPTWIKYISSSDTAYYEQNISHYFNGDMFKCPDISICKNIDKDLQKYMIQALKNHNFSFSYSYFQIFCKIAKNKGDYFGEYADEISLPLSIIHLNSFTKWFDALMLIHKMPLQYVECEYMFFQKMLLTYSEFEEFICSLSYANLRELLLSQNLASLYKNITENFYKNACSKLRYTELLNIFEPNNGRKQIEPHFDIINPIYKWIKILDWSIPLNEFDLLFPNNENKTTHAISFL